MTPNISAFCSQHLNASTVTDQNATSRELLEQNASAIIEKLVERVMLSALTSLRLCVERIIPPAKQETEIYFALPEGKIDSADNMLQMAGNLAKAVSEGGMTIKEAEKFTHFLKQQRRQIDETKRNKQHEK